MHPVDSPRRRLTSTVDDFETARQSLFPRLLVLFVTTGLLGCAAPVEVSTEEMPEAWEWDEPHMRLPTLGKSDAVVFSSQLWPQGNLPIVHVRYPLHNPRGYWRLVSDFRKVAAELAKNTPVRLQITSDAPQTGPYVHLSNDDDPDRYYRYYVSGMGTAGDYVHTDRRAMRHEVGHLLGLYHEHQRPDRDEYITIHPRAVPDWRVIQTVSSAFQPVIGPYDFESVMHYPDNYGGICMVMTRKELGLAAEECVQDLPAEDRITPNRLSFSEGDYRVISALYCEPEYCGENCAPPARCNRPAVRARLQAIREWRAQHQQSTPAM